MKRSMMPGVWRFWTLCLLALAGQAAAQVREQAYSLETPTGAIAGTLALPSDAGKPTVVLIIAGSGPTDRDGNSRGLPGRNDSLRMLAAALADAGFASVRYDKRGIGASLAAGPSESALPLAPGLVEAIAGFLRGVQR